MSNSLSLEFKYIIYFRTISKKVCIFMKKLNQYGTNEEAFDSFESIWYLC